MCRKCGAVGQAFFACLCRWQARMHAPRREGIAALCAGHVLSTAAGVLPVALGPLPLALVEAGLAALGHARTLVPAVRAGRGLGAADLVLLGDVEQHLFRREQAVAVAVHQLELGDRLAAASPLIQADLAVAVGVQLLEPRRQVGGQLAGANDRRPLIVVLFLGGRVLDAKRRTGLADGIAGQAVFQDRAVVGLVLHQADDAVVVGVPG